LRAAPRPPLRPAALAGGKAMPAAARRGAAAPPTERPVPCCCPWPQVGAFCARLLSIEYIDLAEQSLQALEKLSHEYSHHLLENGGLLAVRARPGGRAGLCRLLCCCRRRAAWQRSSHHLATSTSTSTSTSPSPSPPYPRCSPTWTSSPPACSAPRWPPPPTCAA
jgi:hypothetical protein